MKRNFLFLTFDFLVFIRQKEKLQMMMSASGYEEKVPANIKEDNVAKLAKILQEFDFFEKESARLVAEGNEQMKQK